jgi:16S rRNA (guanine527-N7)-methyltransferase
MSLLDRYATRVLTSSERAGLTSLRSQEAIQMRYFAESFAALSALEAKGFLTPTAIDVGSGAGIPGIPFAIAHPEMHFTLLEAIGRKAAFLDAVAAELGLANVRVLNARAEAAAHQPEHRAAYGLAIARAVAPLRVLVELTLPFLVIGGVLAAHKGSGARREIAEAQGALRVLGGEVVSAEPVTVHGSDTPAPVLVIVRKTAETPERYPRRPGIPAKRPL